MPIYKIVAAVQCMDEFIYEAPNEDVAIKYCRKYGQHFAGAMSHELNEALMARANMEVSVINKGDVDPEMICSCPTFLSNE